MVQCRQEEKGTGGEGKKGKREKEEEYMGGGEGGE